jgi:hypothetical protein
MAGIFGTCPEQSYQRAVSEYNNSRSQSQEQGWSAGLTVNLAVARSFWLSQIDSARWQEETRQRSSYLAKFLSPSDILGPVLLEKKDEKVR